MVEASQGSPLGNTISTSEIEASAVTLAKLDTDAVPLQVATMTTDTTEYSTVSGTYTEVVAYTFTPPTAASNILVGGKIGFDAKVANTGRMRIRVKITPVASNIADPTAAYLVSWYQNGASAGSYTTGHSCYFSCFNGSEGANDDPNDMKFKNGTMTNVNLANGTTYTISVEMEQTNGATTAFVDNIDISLYFLDLANAKAAGSIS